MFERFTAQARAAVHRAVVGAEERGSATVGVEHLLRSLADDRSPETAGALSAVGVPPEDLEDVLAQAGLAARRGGVGVQDAEALRTLGIDVDAVVAGVERHHGEGALVPPARRRRGAQRERPPFSSEAKLVLELSLREVQAAGERELGAEHVLLGLLAGNDPVSQELARRGVTRAAVRTALRRTD